MFLPFLSCIRLFGFVGAEAAPEEEEEPEELKPIVNLQLDSFDEANKIKVIKEVKTLSGLGLKESKELVEGVPRVFLEGIKREEAVEMIKAIEDVGGKVSLI